MTQQAIARFKRVVPLLAVLVLAGLAPACGGNGVSEASAAEVKPLREGIVPAELLGLKVSAEDISQAQAAKTSFVDGIGLYSLRAGETLQATLQVSRFTEEADVDSAAFKQQVVQQIGASTPVIFRMGKSTVWLTTGRRQNVAVWFTDRHLFVLATREEFDRPRALLRAALEIKP